MENVNIKMNTIRQVLNQLDNIVSISKDEVVKEKVNKVISTINEEINVKNKVSIEELIHKKMVEMKTRDEGLHFKLYMLYRKLQDGKITEEDAKNTYKAYFGILE